MVRISTEGTKPSGLQSIFTRLTTIMFLLILIGFLGFLFASLMVQSRMWGGTLPGGGAWDRWGTSVAPEFFLLRDASLFFLMFASILFLMLIWIDIYQTEKPQLGRLDRNILAGLFLPSLILYGDPGGAFYNIAPIDFGVTAILSPIYNFTFTGMWSTGSKIALNGLPSILLLLGLVELILGFSQVLVLRYYELKRVSMRVFLMPIVASLAISLLLFIGGLPDFLSPFSGYAKLSMPVPLLTIGILIRGLSKNYRTTL